VSEIVAYAESPRGSAALRRRTDGDGGEPIFELIVNGTFVMDTVDSSTERLLAEAALERTSSPGTVVVGGLGLGFTVQALLDDERVRHIDVIELEPAVIDWVRAGRIPQTAGLLDDSRVRTYESDVRRWLPDQPDASADVILLDVDNGPGFLVHLANAEIYERPFLDELARVLRPQGVVVFWSAAPARRLRKLLERRFGACEELHRVVRRDARVLDYYLYCSTTA
jgi:spermidine synthase